MATITNHLTLDWRIDVAPAAYLGGPTGVIGAQPVLDVRDHASRVDWSSYFNQVGTHVPDATAVDATLLTPSVSSAAYSGVQAVVHHFFGDYYYRIWCVPRTLVVTNPVLGIPYNFHIWNAYPSSKNLTAVGGTGQTGLTLDFTPPEAYTAIEYREVSVTIGATAPIEIDAHYEFTFNATGLFDFITSLARFVDVAPEPPITETWEFLTDIIRAYDGSTQRIALRDNPRITQRFTLLIEDDAVRQNLYNQWYKSLPANIVIPYSAYASGLTQAVAVSATKLYFDVSLTDLRDDDFLILLDPATEATELVSIDTVDADGATLNSGVVNSHGVGTLVLPGHRSRLSNPSGLSMGPLTGSMQVNSAALQPRSPLSRPGSLAVINTFDGYNVLDRLPLAEPQADDQFNAGIEIFDNETGAQDVKTSWTHPFVRGKRKYLVQRHFQPVEMDYWRDFVDATKGQQNPFLLPSFRSDLTKAADPPEGVTYLDITNSDYKGQYFPYETYTRLQIETTLAGTLWRIVNGVVDNGDGTWRLSLDSAIPIGYGSILKISFLNLVVLASDKVTLTHGHLVSEIELDLTTVDA